jgi:hypothetical protein
MAQVETLQVLDELKIIGLPDITKHFNRHENGIFSVHCEKYNEYGRKQMRSFVITN